MGENNHEIAAESAAVVAAKVAPAAVPGGLLLFGVALSDIALILTIIYTIMMISGWMWDRFVKPRIKARKKALEELAKVNELV